MSAQEPQSFAELTIEAAANELDVLEDHQGAAELRALIASRSTDEAATTEVSRSRAGFAWKHKSAALAYILGDRTFASPADLEPQTDLIGARINLKLDGFHIVNYPGLGDHEIAVRWGVRHHVADPDDHENVTFTQRFEVRDKGASAHSGHPIFLGLKVAPAGIGFTLDVTYLKNKTAERFLSFLKSPAIESGLEMIAQANPAIGAVTAMAQGAVESLLRSNDGRLIHPKVYVGLDFQSAPTGIRMAEGSYVVAQTPTQSLDWSKWRLADGGDIVPTREGSEETFPYNYYLLRVERSA